MYWNNPIQTVIYPSNSDIIFKSQHTGLHCLFYDPAVNKTDIHNPQTLRDLCAWANQNIAQVGLEKFLEDSKNHDEIANLVKMNLWVHDLAKRGSIKPMLLTYTGRKFNSNFSSGTGASRLRAMERVPSIQTVSAFITTACQFQDKFAHLEQIHTFDRFAELCQAQPGQQFLFRLTDPTAPFGLDWYEYNSHLTATVTPSFESCLTAIKNYFDSYPNTVFTPQWFDTPIDWKFA